MSNIRLIGEEIDDGAQDVVIRINDKELIRICEDGYKEIGLKYEDAKRFAYGVCRFLTNTAGLAIPVKNPEPGICEHSGMKIDAPV